MGIVRILWLLGAALLLAACPKPDEIDRPLPPLDREGEKKQSDLPPAIPAKLEVERVAPDADHKPSARSPIVDIMSSEIKRSMDVLSQQPIPVYYLSYQVYDNRRVVIETDGGALLTFTDDTERFLDTEVRVGSAKLDNRHQLSNEQEDAINAPMPRKSIMPFGTDELSIRHHLWLDTDRRYREAALALRRVLVDKSVTAQEDSPPDFAIARAEEYIESPASLDFDEDMWIKRARDCSKRAFRGVATRATCRLDFELRTVYFVNSEGTVLQMVRPSALMSVSVGVKADDGMPLGRVEQRFARTPAGLPDDAELDRIIARVTSDLNALHRAPVVDPYVGPAILEGRAAGVFFHEVFGHRIEGHRQKQRTSGQTFASKVGEEIMPQWLTVYDDPTLLTANGAPLNGFYRFDDEGVRAQRAILVERGVLKGFIMGRNPIAGFSRSNGHGRKEPGRNAVSRQGNLVVSVSRSVQGDELERALIAEVKRQGKPFGMVFSDISGGFTNTSRFLPQAFKVNPVMAYRVYPDGRRELVRGVDIVGTPLTALGSIMLASREVETFNGMCGAESGWVPVSASAPSLLLKSLEVERGFKGVDRPPVLPPPSIEREPNSAQNHDRRGN
ncbi:MAG: metallopeptidase TldD-related protein [Proteobacteria bacterium]|nr:metallopeptidase TldD-related protein [Pseudomonadota bacterium]